MLLTSKAYGSINSGCFSLWEGRARDGCEPSDRNPVARLGTQNVSRKTKLVELGLTHD